MEDRQKLLVPRGTGRNPPPGLRGPRRRRVGLAALVLILSASGPGRGADCDDLAGMIANFQQVYPSGGPIEVFEGEAGRRVLDRLLLDPDVGKIAFLYSGDGPVTGARGRYLYLVLDERDCIRDRDWIDGGMYDRVVSGN